MSNLFQGTFKVKKEKYDNSIKEYEVIYKRYYWYKYSRKLREVRDWQHEKYYKTLQGAEDAIISFRKNYSYEDYPSFGYNVEESEKYYSHIIPNIRIQRFAIRKRNEI